MRALKQTVLAAAATAALLCIPAKPAAAAGPLLFAPFALAHVIGAVATLAAVSAAYGAQQPAPAPGYGAGPDGYYAPPAYAPPAYAAPAYAPPVYAPPAGYYPAPQAYYRPAPRAYYLPSPSYAVPMQRFYQQPRGYYAPRVRYSGSYGAHLSYRSGGVGYRRR
jgi:hypothetical protein